MTQDQIQTLKVMGVSGVIKKYLPRIGKTPEEGGITRDQYESLLKLVAPVFSREETVVAKNPPVSDADAGDSGTDRTHDKADAQQDGLDSTVIPPQDSIRGFTTNPDQTAGQSQKARILRLLQDHSFHTTIEIMTKVYRVGEDRGIARIASRINDLRNDGHNIETKRITQTLTAYRLV